VTRRRVYFVSDVHASERCWLKFLAAPRFYQADTVIVGGDITGKFVVPIIAQPGGGWTVQNFLGRHWRLSTRVELAKLKSQIADTGQYAFETTPDEHAGYEGDQGRIDELFRRLALERVRRWVGMAEDKLGRAGVRVLVSGGNDDFYEVDEVLAASSLIENPDGRALDLGDGFQIMGVGYGNPTPWNCPRDIPEDELIVKLEAVAARVRDPNWAIFNFHVPPYDSVIDLGPRLGYDLQMKMSMGGADMHPVGSSSVREVIEKYQPFLGLHGHLHESRGTAKLGRTPCLNPGSEYQDGILRGAIIDIDDRRKKVKASMLIAG
jgi:Icc-related predicted phosphoesterase